MTAEELFAALVDALDGLFDATPRSGAPTHRFGAEALKVDGSIFAMLVGGRLVVKLPVERVAELVGDGTGSPFSAGTRRPMRQWVAVGVERGGRWEELAREAVAFVGGR